MDPISIGLVCVALVLLALIGKSWSAQAGTTRVEIAKIEAQRRERDLDEELDMALKEAEEAKSNAKEALDLARRFDSRLSAAESRSRR